MKIGKANLNLHHRIFILLLAVGMAAFLIAGVLSMAGMYSMRKNLDKTGALLADNAAAFTETVAVERVKKQLSAEAEGKAKLAYSVLSAGKTEDFAEVVCHANRQMCENNTEMMFVTVFFGVLDTRTGDFTYVNCGHNPPLLRQGRDGQFAYLRTGNRNVMLGVKDDISFTQETLRLDPGSALFCYTDGVTEAMNAAREVYSVNRLQAALNAIEDNADMPVADMLAAVRQDVDAHVNGVEQSDDITMLAIRYTG